VIFPESWISAQKQNTKAILLKTALVRVSCIQNTQIRGETIAKVFGKVDRFWTYQGPVSLCPSAWAQTTLWSAPIPWTSISGVYALGSPQILSWRGGLLGAVGGGHAWLALLWSPASAAPVGPLRALIKHRLEALSSSPAWAFGGEDLGRLLP
jgi:hypothetical protein